MAVLAACGGDDADAGEQIDGACQNWGDAGELSLFAGRVDFALADRDGSIVIGGSRDNLGVLVRLHPDGTVTDIASYPEVTAIVHVALRPTAGYVLITSGPTAGVLVVDANGQVDQTAACAQRRGRAQEAREVGATLLVKTDDTVTRYGADCNIDTSYGTSGTAQLPEVSAIGADGTGVGIARYDYQTGLDLRRIDRDGKPVADLVTTGWEYMENFTGLAALDDGSFLLSGSGVQPTGEGPNKDVTATILGVDGVKHGSVSQTSTPSSSGNGPLMMLTAEGVMPDGRVVLGGLFESRAVAVLRSDLRPSMITHEITQATVTHVAGFVDGRVIAFGTAGGKAYATCLQP